MLRKNPHNSGFTLVEVLSSIVIISIILISFMSFFTLSARSNQTSEETMDATYTAQTIMENIISINYEGTSLKENSNKIENLLNDIGNVLQVNTTNDFKNLDVSGLINEHNFNVHVIDLNELLHIIIKVFDSENTSKSVAELETIIWLEGN